MDARGLVSEDGEPCDPFIRVECCGKKWQSKTLEDNPGAYVPFNEHNIWPEIMLYPDEFESAYIEFSVYARNWFSRNYLIGKVSIQLDSINKRQFHVYAKKALNIRKEEVDGYTGQLNLTVFCLKPGQQPPSESQQQGGGADDEEKKEEDDCEDLSKIIISNKFEKARGKAYNVCIDIIRCEDLANVPGTITGAGPPSPFVTVEFAGACMKTSEAVNAAQYTWSERAVIPIETPVYEDTILIKLWHHGGALGSDELLAQGMISFSELRNNALPPRWYTFYGWDPDEISDVKTYVKDGESIEPNFFKGSLLIAGRVEPAQVEGSDGLPAPSMTQAKTNEEPMKVARTLLADVYEVTGAEGGSECQVELRYGKVDGSTKGWAKPSTKDRDALLQQPQREDDDDDDEDKDEGEKESFTAFSFTQAEGRIDPLLVMTPEEVASQPKVVINVYTRGRLFSGKRRIGYQMRYIHEFSEYHLGNPSKPRYIPLKSMHDNSKQRLPAAVLAAVDYSKSDDVIRHNRKNVKPMQYIVRAYVFMAREIRTHERKSYALRVSCAGVSKSTAILEEVRPQWMECVDLKVTLCSDHPKEPPTMEPITITLCDQTKAFGRRAHVDMGKAVCQYEYMRQKDNMNKWEPFKLAPQWVKIKGGAYGGTTVGEALLAFELLQWKTRNETELRAKHMWPVPENEFDPNVHFASLRKATLHFSLQGLRDLCPEGLDEKDNTPLVTVRVKKFAKNNPDQKQEDKYFSHTFQYSDLIENGDRDLMEDKLQAWRTDALGFKQCMNYEYYQTAKFDIEVPYSDVLQPAIVVMVNKPERTFLGYFSGNTPGKLGELIGEYRADLTGDFPCCWYEGVNVNAPLDEKQKSLIEKRIKTALSRAQARDAFEEESAEVRARQMREERQRRMEEQRRKNDKQAKRIVLEETEEDAVNSAGLPLELRPFHEKTNPKGRKSREELNVMESHVLNMRKFTSFDEKQGAKLIRKEADMGQCAVEAKLEDSTDESVFKPDFIFSKRPLLLNHDLVPRYEKPETDWHSRQGLSGRENAQQCYGFVRCAWKLVDNCIDATPQAPELQDSSLQNPRFDLEVKLEDKTKIKQTYGIPDMLDKVCFGHDPGKFAKHFKGKELDTSGARLYSYVPSRIRVRIYFVQAICTFSKGASPPDPYLMFHLGEMSVSMRNTFQSSVTAPKFYRVEERDVEMPQKSRLQVDLWDHGGTFGSDTLIGSTIIDLEDRWHSRAFRAARDRKRMPKENRPLYNPTQRAGETMGSIEMWVEMLSSERASEEKATELRLPKPTSIEIRIIMTTKNIKIVDGNHTDVKIGVVLECSEYRGERLGYPKTQLTDVHINCIDGNAEFYWRTVFPSIQMGSNFKTCTLSVMVYDNNNLASDVYIGQVQLDLRKYCERVAAEGEMIENAADLQIKNGDEDVGIVHAILQVYTQTEAEQKKAGMGRDEPNMYPTLVTPTEGRGWADVFGGFEFAFPSFGIWKKVIPLIIFTLVCLVGLRYVGLL
jgi:hypothetical protein